MSVIISNAASLHKTGSAQTCEEYEVVVKIRSKKKMILSQLCELSVHGADPLEQ